MSKKPTTKLPGKPAKLPGKPVRITNRDGAKPAPLGKAPVSPRLKGPDAVKEYQRQVSPSGMKKTKKNQMDATNKKYPGLYKKKK
jgi:hypothetical protein